MRGKPTLFLDQYGAHYTARTLKELQRLVGGGRISKMCVDKKDGGALHIGYVIGPHWLQAFVPFMQEV